MTFFAGKGGVLSDDFSYAGTGFTFSPALPQTWANEWYLFGQDGTLLTSADRGATPDTTELAALKTTIDGLAPLAIMTGSSRLDIKEGGTAPLRVKLSEQPAGPVSVAVSRRSGDADITIAGSATLSFTTANWNTWQEVTIAAATDADAAAGSAVLQLSATLAGIPASVLPDGTIRQLVQAYEIEGTGATSQGVVTGWTYMGVPKGGTMKLGVHLAKDPGGSYALRAERLTTNDVYVEGGSTILNFDSSNWWRMQYVRISAKAAAGTTAQTVSFYQGATATKLRDLTLYAVDADPAKSGGAGDEPIAYTLVTSANSCQVTEGATATFTVRLSSAPAASTTVTTTRVSGDTGITVSSGSSLTFSTANWNTPQTITVAAATDADFTNDTAVMRCSTPDVPSVDVTVTEMDTGDTAPPQITVAAQGTTPVTGTTTSLSVTATDDGGATGLTYTWSQIAGPAASSFAAGNGGNGARLLVATVPMAGTYRYRVTVRDPALHGVTSDTNDVVVQAVAGSLAITPGGPVTVTVGDSLVLTAAIRDQFGAITTGTPVWSVVTTDGGIIDATGHYTAPDIAMTCTIRATCGALSDEVTVAVTATPVVGEGTGDGGNGGSRSCGLGGSAGSALAMLLLAARLALLGRARRNNRAGSPSR